jgi:pre-mRNA-splicing factor ATP-dependent RNA helicase DHX16
MTDKTDYVADKLFNILGITDDTLVSCIESMIDTAKNEQALTGNLTSLGFPSDKTTLVLAQDLINRFKNVPAPPVITEQPDELPAQNDYRMVEEGEDTDEDLEMLNKLNERQKQNKELEKLAKDEDNVELVQVLKEKDKLERDLLIKRIIEKDKIKKAAKSNLTKEDQTHLIPELRDQARIKYLEKREDQQLDIFERTLKEQERLFKGVDVTDMEKHMISLDRKILELAKKRKERDNKLDLYQMPDAYEDEHGHLRPDRKKAALMKRYEEVKTEMTEQEIWEQTQNNKTVFDLGSQKKSDKDVETKDYDLLIENQVDFIQSELLEGEMNNLIKKKMKGGDNSNSSKSDGSSSSESEGETEVPMTEFEKERKKIHDQRVSLPVYDLREDFLKAIRDNQVLVIVGETGSGKTTQLPQYLHEVGYTKKGKIGITQPRRVAAMSVAARVAEELNVKLGQEVGYSIRFEDSTSDSTVLKYMTDGILLREFLTEPDLKSYSCLMIDEAHERTLHTDILFGLVKDVARSRPDLKLLISSATLDAEKFASYFDNSKIFKIPGRRYPVDIYYTKAPEADYIEAAVVTALQIHVTQPEGDILLFLTGQEEIESATEMIQQRIAGLGSKIKEMIIRPIYSALPSELQAQIFEKTPPGARKIVLATNIAETSLTIEGIIYVIDTGFVKMTSYNPKTGMESLVVTPVSKASANQRAGRAGRVSAGK